MNKTTAYRRILKLYRNYIVWFVLGISATLLMSGTDSFFAWSMNIVMKKSFIKPDKHFVAYLPLFVVLLALVRGLSNFGARYALTRMNRSAMRDLRCALFKKFLHLPASYFDKSNSARLLSIMLYNIDQVSQAGLETLVNFFQDGSLCIGLLAVLFLLNWKFTLIFLVVSPAIAAIMRWSSRRMHRLGHSIQDTMGELTRISQEGVRAYDVIRIYGGQAYENNKFETVTKDNLVRELKVAVTNSVAVSTTQILVVLSLGAVLYFSSKVGNMQANTFVAFVTAIVMLIKPLKRITNLNTLVQKGLAGAEGVFSVLDEPDEKNEGTALLQRVKGNIDFKDVKFEYTQEGGAVLQDISLSVKAGKTLAIVGHSGGGKSTLVSLLPRFYEPTSGKILLDGHDIREYRLADLRRQFAWVSQNIVLFDATVEENIAYAMDGQVPQKALRDAAEAAYALEFIEKLPQGFNTRIGTDGTLLSGGQRQRIAIARALLSDAPVLVLDEATAALDTSSEQRVQEALEYLMQGRTTFVIAHRLSTIKNADEIIVMDKGRIVETGCHEELLKKENGYYTQLYQAQFLGER